MIRIVCSDQDTPRDVIHSLMAIEEDAYDPIYRGEFEAICKRFEKYQEMFVFAYDQDEMVGYLCFFPVSERLYKELVSKDAFHDDDILPEDIRTPAESSHIYLLSIALKRKYQKMGTGRSMMDTFLEKIRSYQGAGCVIDDILASVVSQDGERIAKAYGFELIQDHAKTSQYCLYCKTIR